MKSEYSLNVNTTVKDAEKRVMKMPGSHGAEGIYFNKENHVLWAWSEIKGFAI